MTTDDRSRRVWFVTGAGRGLGRAFTEAILEQGDAVVATARDVTTLDDLAPTYGDALLPLRVDVTDRNAVFAAVERAHAEYDHLDVVVNNAGYGLFGAVEELAPAEMLAQLDVNLLGPLHVVQAALPRMRERRAGHIIQISTIGGLVAFPLLGGYHASKWALEGLTESLAQEVAPFGIAVTLVEPGGYATDWAGSSARWTAQHAAYDELRAERFGDPEATRAQLSADPAAAGRAILAVADADPPPSRVFFGSRPLGIVEGVYAQRLETWRAHRDLSAAAE
jgi:NAD(P)-dependent dehydrogenase (short-subunit alcohol dehydrogenase family)